MDIPKVLCELGLNSLVFSISFNMCNNMEMVSKKRSSWETNNTRSGTFNKSYNFSKSSSFGSNIFPTSDNGYIVAGTTSEVSMSFDAFLIKIDSKGEIEWQRAYGSKEYHDYGYMAIETQDGGFILSGSTQSYGTGAWIVRTDSKGNELWNKTMPFGTQDDVRSEVKRIAELAGSTFGYIFCTSHNIQADTPIENVQTLMEAYLEYGWR